MYVPILPVDYLNTSLDQSQPQPQGTAGVVYNGGEHNPGIEDPAIPEIPVGQGLAADFARLSTDTQYPCSHPPVADDSPVRHSGSGYGRVKHGRLDNVTKKSRPKHWRQQRKRGTSKNLQSWTCPFAVADSQNHKRCIIAKLPRWSDFGQHMRRKHTVDLNLVCPHCYEHHETAEERHIHAESCKVRASSRFDLISNEELHQIMYSPRYSSNEDKWFALLKRLFPDRTGPDSPYNHDQLSCGTNPDYSSIASSLKATLPGIVSACLNVTPTPEQFSCLLEMVLANIFPQQHGNVSSMMLVLTSTNQLGCDRPHGGLTDSPRDLIDPSFIGPTQSNISLLPQAVEGNGPINLGYNAKQFPCGPTPFPTHFSQQPVDLQVSCYPQPEDEAYYANTFDADHWHGNQ